MPDIFDALPGLDVPVDSISKSLGEMWASTAAAGGAAPASDDAKATQVNFVLHLGFLTSAEDAAEQFRTAVEFSKRYPSRIVVLCPQVQDDGGIAMRAKIYGECHLGKSKGDKRCVEFVMLSYPRRARQFLENQVSICLSTDLPLYYWAHRFSASSKLADYNYLLTRARRVLIDSAVAPDDALTYPWPHPGALRDLAFARLLPVRQSLGQFLSRYPMNVLCEGLAAVTLTHAPQWKAEARVLLDWLRDRIGECGRNEAVYALEARDGQGLAVGFRYAGGAKRFSWTGDLATGHAWFDADFGTGPTHLPAAASVLAPDEALSQAMFF